MHNLENYIQINLQKNNHFDQFLYEHKLSGFYHKDKSYYLQLHRNSLNQEFVQELNLFLGQKNIRITKLKGISLIDHLYEDIGRRWMSDIDLLINKKDIKEICSYLTEKGFEEIQTEKWKANDFKWVFTHTIEGIEQVIELHTDLFYHQQNIDYQLTQTQHTHFDRLSLEYEFIHLVGHAIFQHNLLLLYWFNDCLEFYQKYHQQMDWKLVYKISKKIKLHRSCEIFFYFLQTEFKVELEKDVLELFKVNKFKIWKLFFSKKNLLNPRQRSISYLIIKNLTKDSFIEAFKYNLLWLKNKFFR